MPLGSSFSAVSATSSSQLSTGGILYSFLAAGPHSPVWVILGPKLFFVTGLVIFVTAVARLVCPDLLG